MAKPRARAYAATGSRHLQAVRGAHEMKTNGPTRMLINVPLNQGVLVYGHAIKASPSVEMIICATQVYFPRPLYMKR